MKSTFRTMMLSLTLVTLVVGALLGGVYALTVDTIAQSKEAAKRVAIARVLPATNDSIVTCSCGFAAWKDSSVIAYAVETTTDGFGGPIKLLVGIDTANTILDYVVLEHSETPGLGAKAQDWFTSIKGRTCDGSWKVSKDGGSVDAITAATITSRAFVKGINDAVLSSARP